MATSPSAPRNDILFNQIWYDTIRRDAVSSTPVPPPNPLTFLAENFMMRQLLLWGSQNPWLSQKLPRYRFVQRAVRRFIPGEELEAALTEAARSRSRRWQRL